MDLRIVAAGAVALILVLLCSFQFYIILLGSVFAFLLG